MQQILNVAILILLMICEKIYCQNTVSYCSVVIYNIPCMAYSYCMYIGMSQEAQKTS